ncbi:hypothetical protein B0H16DRAFT_1334514 [Mycena metata]|uniref:DNA/RNA-binding domain-containing protein n=1 Tax=Mycena metata TaxID=1033252 RepID=A0AAD7HKI4_9AGAR|nr:hypothetical protein B0H16DRAFT_1334514 [Mycena metata]
MQTSYAFIALYKQRLARPAHGVHSHNNPNQNNTNFHGNNSNGNTGNTTVETRKLLQRFRQFLADEERFWRALILRLQRAYGVPLPDTLPSEVLGTLSINALNSNTTAGTSNGGELDDRDGNTTTEDRMNHFGFPPEAAFAAAAPAAVDECQAHSALSKTLVCLGDIARYREQYKVPPSANFKGGKGGNVPGGKKPMYFDGRPNFNRARALYLAAHALAPGEGNAAHQLAILAGYESDTLSSVAWYLRALCVRAPFDTAGENLAGVLARARATQNTNPNSKHLRVGGGAGDDAPPRVKIERFKRELVLLHALWRDASTPPAQTLALAAHTTRVFARLVAARALPEELIVRVILVAQGAVWVGRMIESPTPRDREREKERTRAAHLAHLFALHTALLGVGVRELGEPELAERISAEFRRTLPALRVGSKWILGNWGWVGAEGVGLATSASGEEGREGDSPESGELHTRRAAFWTMYAEFLRRLVRTFPATLLPALSLELEEDLDVRGWLPLRGLMERAEVDVTSRRRRTVGLREEVHPNVEQLMRIADLLRDAKRIVELEGSPLALYGGQFVVKGVEAAKPAGGVTTHPVPAQIPIPIPPQVQKRTTRFEPPPPVERDDEDDAMTEHTSRTDDDILHDAFSFLNQAESESGAADSDEDEIVWDLRFTPVRPIGPPPRGPPAPIATTAPLSPFRAPQPQLQPQPPQPITPGTKIPATTALDLLNNFAVPKVSPMLHKPNPITTGPGELLFGSRAPQSIWSASRDEQGLMFSGGTGGSQGSTIWASSHPSASQHHVSTGFGQPPPVHAPLQHQRGMSHSMAGAQLFPSGPDHYGYGALSPPVSAPAPVSQYAAPGMAPEQLGVFYSTSPGGPAYGFAAQQQVQGHGHGPHQQQHQHQHARHLSLAMHDPRATFHGHGQPVTPMSQPWGNVG